LYIGAGGVATAAHYAITVAGVEAAGLSPVVATTIGFAFGAAVKYWLNYAMTFRSEARHSRAVLRFAVMLALLWGLNAALMAGLAYGLGLHYMAAQVLTTCLLIPPGYLMSRNWVFS
jgi:putative flippase GtrA